MATRHESDYLDSINKKKICIPPSATGDPDFMGKIGRCRNGKRCRNVWLCPRCAERELSRRRREAGKRIAAHKGPLVLATYTVAHAPDEPLIVVVARLMRAVRLLKRGRPWRRIMQAAGVTGSTRVLEIAHNAQAGWNPHYHEIILLKHGVAAFRAGIYSRFAAWGHADVRAIRRGADHIARTLHYTYKGARPHADALGGRNGAAILADAQAGDPASQGLALEMAFALHGVHRTAGRLPTG